MTYKIKENFIFYLSIKQKNLKENGIDQGIYDTILPETPDTNCLELASYIQENHFDGLLAVGGGSVIDTTKEAGMILALPQPIEDLHDYSGTGTKMKNEYQRKIKFRCSGYQRYDETKRSDDQAFL